MTENIEHMLRGWASLTGVDPDAVVADYRHGGPLAQMVRASLGGAVRLQPGPDIDLEENWRRFVIVVTAKRQVALMPKPRPKGVTTFSVAAELGEQQDPHGDPENRRPERYKGTYYKMQRKLGWCDEDVPMGLAAFFSGPPSVTD